MSPPNTASPARSTTPITPSLILSGYFQSDIEELDDIFSAILSPSSSCQPSEPPQPEVALIDFSNIAPSQLSKTNVLSRNIISENQNSTHVVNETSFSLGHSTMPLLDLTFDDANTVSHASQVNSASTIFTLANSFHLVPSVPPTTIDHLEPNYKHEDIIDAIVVPSPVTVTSDLFLSLNMPSHLTIPTPPTQSVPAVNPPD